MFLAKLCDALGTNIDGLHDSLSLIQGVAIQRHYNCVEVTNINIIYKCFTRYELKKDDISFILNVWQTEDNNGARLFAHVDEEDCMWNYLTNEEAESKFLELIAKRTVRVKSARN
jgi:hypothetical protein